MSNLLEIIRALNNMGMNLQYKTSLIIKLLTECNKSNEDDHLSLLELLIEQGFTSDEKFGNYFYNYIT